MRRKVPEKSSFCTTHKSSVSPGFAKQIMPILRILCYNGSLVTWMVASLTTSKFKPLIFSMSGFTFSYTANVGSDRQRKHLSISHPRKCLLITRTPYPRKHRPVTGWFPRIHLHGNVFADSFPSNGVHVTISTTMYPDMHMVVQNDLIPELAMPLQ
jgi:hypothetical protein